MDTKITYTMQGDYNLPDLTLPEQEEREIGIWDSVAGTTSKSIIEFSTTIF